MSTGNIMVLSGIVFAFAIFAVALMWGDLYSHPSYSTPYRKAKERMAFTGSFGDKSWSRNSII